MWLDVNNMASYRKGKTGKQAEPDLVRFELSRLIEKLQLYH